MAIMRWDPFAEVDRVLEVVAGRGSNGDQPATRGMPMDVYRDGDEYVVEMDLPGIDPSSIDISVERNMLTVEGESRTTHEHADEVVVCERRHIRYRRQLYLGDNVDTDNVRASYENGVLVVRVPISTQQRPRKVEVAASGDARAIPDQSRNASAQETSQSKARKGEKVGASAD
jgi:HSP20 family protein